MFEIKSIRFMVKVKVDIDNYIYKVNVDRIRFLGSSLIHLNGYI
jgi:hypothetical protein